MGMNDGQHGFIALPVLQEVQQEQRAESHEAVVGRLGLKCDT